MDGDVVAAETKSFGEMDRVQLNSVKLAVNFANFSQKQHL